MNVIEHILEFGSGLTCHLRVVFDSQVPDARFVVVCTQLPGSYAPSIAINFERIAQEFLVQQMLTEKRFDTDQAQWSRWLTAVWLERIATASFEGESLLENFEGFLATRPPERRTIPWPEIFEAPRFIWLERVPNRDMPALVDDFAYVMVADREGAPTWTHFRSGNHLLVKTGYTEQQLLCPVADLRKPNLAGKDRTMKQRGMSYLEMLLALSTIALLFLLERGFGLLGERVFVPVVDGVALALVALGVFAVAGLYRQSRKQPKSPTELAP